MESLLFEDLYGNIATLFHRFKDIGKRVEHKSAIRW